MILKVHEKYIFFRILILFGILSFFSFLSIRIKAADNQITDCPKEIVTGDKFKYTGPNEWELSSTVAEFVSKDFIPSSISVDNVEDFNRMQILRSRFGLLKLRAFENLLTFVGGDSFQIGDYIYDLTDEKKFNESLKFGKGPDLSWNKIKRYLATMKVYECLDIKNYKIFLKGSLSSNDIKTINNQIALDDAYIDLYYYFTKKEIDKLEKKFPNIYENQNPKFFIDLINSKKKEKLDFD